MRGRATLAQAMHRRRSVPLGPRGARGMTLVEILVALGVLAMAIGSILTIFMTGSRFGARTREKLEAGRVALAVFDLVDKGFDVGGTPYGRRSTGPLAGQLVNDEEVESSLSSRVLGDAAFAARSPVPLVWKYKILDHTVDGVPMHRIEITVRLDTDGSGDPGYLEYDDTDRLIRVYHALLADRRVTP